MIAAPGNAATSTGLPFRWLAATAVLLVVADVAAADPLEAGLATAKPLLGRYCLDCHSGDGAEGEVDLAALDNMAAFRAHPKLVRRVEEMVANGQMPPPDSEQPSAAERESLDAWLKAFLAAEARAHAGDPGRVVLRRLNNAEYTHTIRDLAGVESLDPAGEFPADGGAGEGFTNTGQSLVMSPSLVDKYLDAAKRVAAHTVLLPDSIAFSAGDSRRDFADDWLGRIKAFYGRYAGRLAAAQSTVKDGVKLDMGTEGFLPVERYVRATLDLRARQPVDAAAIEAVARDHALSPKYLARLWQSLAAPDSGSLVLDRIRAAWRSASPAEAAEVAAEIGRWQDAVWTFNSVGQIGRHLGRKDGPASWQEAVAPLVREKEFRIKLPPAAAGDASAPITLHLAAGDAGDGDADDVVVFRAPRLVAAGRADIPLRHVRARAAAFAWWQPQVAKTAEACLAAVDEAMAAGREVKPDELATTLAAKHGVDPRLLRGWFTLLGVGGGRATIDALTEKDSRIGGWDFITGWRGPDDVSVRANASDQEVSFPQVMRPHGITVHPAPSRRVVVAWQSPITGRVRIEAAVQDAHDFCGNGFTWRLERRRGSARQALAQGAANAERQAAGPIEVPVQDGDMITIAIGARDGDHVCDSTAVDLTITSLDAPADAAAVWDLARDCSADLLAANPHADAHGRPGIWHFGSEPDAIADEAVLVEGSTLARWFSGPAADRPALARELAAQLAQPQADPADGSPDALLARSLTAATGPLLTRLLDEGVRGAEPVPGPAGGPLVGLDPDGFGRAPDGIAPPAIGPDDLCVRAPQAFTIEIPRSLAAGWELVTTAALPAGAGPQASVQPWVGLGPAPSVECSAAAAIVTADPSPAHDRFTRAFAEFRDLFPKALCYARIVPVDEVVTLNLFYREDDHLRRLMLDDAEVARLDQLWDELLFVAREPLEFEDVFEQLRAYATQGLPDLVVALDLMQPAITARAEAFAKRLVEVEPRHVDALVGLAGRAFRRPLQPDEESRLRTLYDTLRHKDLPHEEAIRTVIAHVLVAPEFLYKLETPGPGTEAGPVGDFELATRLSYFLWSSLPDADLLAAAASGRLQDAEVLRSQTRRMLASPASRRLAEEFGTQWLHVYGFATLDEKNAELFPTFAGLRADMEEETVRLLDDFFKHDRSILSLIDADHTFLNESLAAHYGIEGVTGPEWRRVDGVRRHGRGGILGLATTLSTQAGASRTSPILRGNWLYETILGEKLPKPPKDVPQLAETVPLGLSERQLIALHSENAACAKCHRRIDPFGFALEEFDAIGRHRTTDAAGNPLDVTATLPDGATLVGQQGLRDYLLGPRRDQFVRVFCRKLLGYALGRGVQLSDEPLLDEMVSRLAAADYRVSVAIDAIVSSPQFRSIRGRDAADDAT